MRRRAGESSLGEKRNRRKGKSRSCAGRKTVRLEERPIRGTATAFGIVEGKKTTRRKEERGRKTTIRPRRLEPNRLKELGPGG